MVTFTEEILNGKLRFLRSVGFQKGFTSFCILSLNTIMYIVNYGIKEP